MKDSSPMVKSTPVQSLMFGEATLTGSPSVTSSPASAAGRLPCVSPAGQKTAPPGPGVPPANPSPALENSKAHLMIETSGRPLCGSSESENLSASLASRLRLRLEATGSTEYQQTWKRKRTPLGRLYWAHTASGRRTSGKDFTGWPTPRVDESTEDCSTKRPSGCHKSQNLTTSANLCGWTTPQAHDTHPRGSGQSYETNGAGNACLGRDAQTAGWNTPHCPRKHDSDNSKSTYLDRQLASGPLPSGTNAATGKPAALVLNPRFSLWLMGYPDVWASCGARAMQSLRRSPRSS